MKLLLFVIIAAGLAVYAVFAVRHDRKRRLLLRAWADAHGFRMRRRKTSGWDLRCPGFQLLDRGDDRHSTIDLDGELDGRTVRCLDYRYTTGSGDNEESHRLSAVILEMGTPVIPLHIRHESIADRFGEFIGLGDIDFESAEFSRRFHVTSSDRRWAYDVIHQRTMEYLMTLPTDVVVAFGMMEVGMFMTGALTAERCRTGLQIVKTLRDLVPADVLAQLRGE